MCEFDLVSDRKVKDKVIGVRVTKEEKDLLEESYLNNFYLRGMGFIWH